MPLVGVDGIDDDLFEEVSGDDPELAGVLEIEDFRCFPEDELYGDNGELVLCWDVDVVFGVKNSFVDVPTDEKVEDLVESGVDLVLGEDEVVVDPNDKGLIDDGIGGIPELSFDELFDEIGVDENFDDGVVVDPLDKGLIEEGVDGKLEVNLDDVDSDLSEDDDFDVCLGVYENLDVDCDELTGDDVMLDDFEDDLWEELLSDESESEAIIEYDSEVFDLLESGVVIWISGDDEIVFGVLFAVDDLEEFVEFGVIVPVDLYKDDERCGTEENVDFIGVDDDDLLLALFDEECDWVELFGDECSSLVKSSDSKELVEESECCELFEFENLPLRFGFS